MPHGYPEKDEAPEKEKKKKWSLGGFFKRKSKKSDTETSSDNDDEYPKRRGFLSRRKRSDRGSKDVTNAFVIQPLVRGTPESGRSVESVIKKGSTNSLDHNGKRRVKAKVEASRERLGAESSSDEASSYTSSLQSGGSFPRRSRAARTERYIKRMSKDMDERPKGSRWTAKVVYHESSDYDQKYTAKTHSATPSPAQSPKVRPKMGGSPIPKQSLRYTSSAPNGYQYNFGQRPYQSYSYENNINSIHQGGPYLNRVRHSPPTPPPRRGDPRPMSFAFEPNTVGLPLPQDKNISYRSSSEQHITKRPMKFGSTPSNSQVSLPPSPPSHPKPYLTKIYPSQAKYSPPVNRHVLNNGPSPAKHYIEPLKCYSYQQNGIQKPNVNGQISGSDPYLTSNFNKPISSRVKPVQDASQFWKEKDEQVARSLNMVSPKLKPKSESHKLPSPRPAPRTRLPLNTNSSPLSEEVAFKRCQFHSENEPNGNCTVLSKDTEDKSLSVVSEKSEVSDVELSNRLKPPTAPERKTSRQSSVSSDITDDSKERKTHSNNLEEALCELEAIYKKLSSFDCDKASSKSLPNSNLRRDSESDSVFNYSHESLNSNGVHDIVKDDMAYRRLNKREPSCQDVRDIMSQAGSYLLVSPTLSPPPVTWPLQTNPNEPDITLDDVVYRNINHTNNTLKILDPQPPFGIPLGPISRAPNSDYLHVSPTPSDVLKQTDTPDVVLDDLAFRNLRKDNQESVVNLKKKKAVRSLSANLTTLVDDNYNYRVNNNFLISNNNNNTIEEGKSQSYSDIPEQMRLAQKILDIRRTARMKAEENVMGANTSSSDTLRYKSSSPTPDRRTPTKEELRKRFFADVYVPDDSQEESKLLEKLAKETQAASEQINLKLQQISNKAQSVDTKADEIFEEEAAYSKSMSDLLKELTMSLNDDFGELPSTDSHPGSCAACKSNGKTSYNLGSSDDIEGMSCVLSYSPVVPRTSVESQIDSKHEIEARECLDVKKSSSLNGGSLLRKSPFSVESGDNATGSNRVQEQLGSEIEQESLKDIEATASSLARLTSSTPGGSKATTSATSWTDVDWGNDGPSWRKHNPWMGKESGSLLLAIAYCMACVHQLSGVDSLTLFAIFLALLSIVLFILF